MDVLKNFAIGGISGMTATTCVSNRTGFIVINYVLDLTNGYG